MVFFQSKAINQVKSYIISYQSSPDESSRGFKSCVKFELKGYLFKRSVYFFQTRQPILGGVHPNQACSIQECP